jgi:hypothetical protein
MRMIFHAPSTGHPPTCKGCTTDETKHGKVTQSLHDEVYDILNQRFGSDWRKDLEIIMRADTLSWIVCLAEQGLKDRIEKFKASSKSDISERLSIGSLMFDLETLVEKIAAARIVPAKKRTR